MKTDLGVPADTRSMGIVHSALRRDLVRTRIVVRDSAPAPARRRAVAAHLVWMMDFLNDHHRAEDDGLYPMVLEHNPQAAALLAQMDADHRRILPAIDALAEAGRAYGEDRRDAGKTVLTAVEETEQVLLPHLRREEEEMMPIVSASITEGQWQRWDQDFNVKPRGLLELADIGHWILDGLDEAGRTVITHLVPPVPRFILVRGFAGRYRRRRTALWGGTAADQVPSLSLQIVEQWS